MKRGIDAVASIVGALLILEGLVLFGGAAYLRRFGLTVEDAAMALVSVATVFVTLSGLALEGVARQRREGWLVGVSIAGMLTLIAPPLFIAYVIATFRID